MKATLHLYCTILRRSIKWVHQENNAENSMAVKWLELYTFIAGGMDSIPGWGNEIPHAMTWPKK